MGLTVSLLPTVTRTHVGLLDVRVRSLVAPRPSSPCAVSSVGAIGKRNWKYWALYFFF